MAKVKAKKLTVDLAPGVDFWDWYQRDTAADPAAWLAAMDAGDTSDRFATTEEPEVDGDLTTEPDAEGHPVHGLVLCSIIASSTDPTYTNPDVYPRGFVMLIKIPAATGGGIE